ncbi:DUF4062 domain-containing protein [uncultured Bacteroides sp.]|uniref:DUF4062 domain-containing protein n=1 Tax=uncultured Bacteroides sp. TaxID=162156 RepID=UPI0025FBF760|nr:DUF4062 domain-containing protein [uncultured Bacteroides sp.]
MYRRKYIRLFVSSTFVDMEVERDLLQYRVFPEIYRYCNQKGWQFEGVDLRWGISQEAGYDQKTMQICLDELRRCQELSPQPNFLILLGERYGWIPLPEKIPAEDAIHIMSVATKKEAELFTCWYQLDTNTLNGGEYILQPRKGKYRNPEFYQKNVEQPLRILIDKFSNRVKDNQKRLYYNSSATEQEIIKGALTVTDSQKHVILYLRRLKKIPSGKKIRYYEQRTGIWKHLVKGKYSNEIKRLRNSLKKKVLTEHILEEYISYNELISESYAERFYIHVTNIIKQIVDTEIARYSAFSPLEIEKEIARDFMQARCNLFVGREEETKRTLNLLPDNKSSKPVFVLGPAGSGKSAFMSHLASQIEKSAKANVIIRFAGVSANLNTGNSLLRSVWDEINTLYPTNDEFSIAGLAKRLRDIQVMRPLFVFIDALDQLPTDDPIFDLIWMIPSTAPNVHLVLSILDSKEYIRMYPFLQELRALNLGPSTVRLAPLEKDEAFDLINLQLAKEKRQLSEEQNKHLKQIILATDRNPLYLQLLAYTIVQWHSYDNIPTLAHTSEGLLENYFNQLSQSDNHGRLLVAKVLSILASAKYGVSLRELCEILATDDEYWEAFTKTVCHPLHRRVVPAVICIRLYNDLERFLSSVASFNTLLIMFYHRVIREFVQCHYLPSLDAKHLIHHLLYDYYNSKWRENEQHALHEVSYQAMQLGDKQLLIRLFSNLEYCAYKIYHGCSEALRNEINMAIKLPYLDSEAINTLNEMKYFDAEASSYVTMADPEKKAEWKEIKNMVYQLAAGYMPHTIVRKAFENQNPYPSLVNTLGHDSEDNLLFRTISTPVNSTARISDDGKLILWSNNGQMIQYSADDASSHYILKGQQVTIFELTQDWAFLIGYGEGRLFCYDMQTKDKVFLTNCNEASSLSVWKDTVGTIHISLGSRDNLYIIEYNSENRISATPATVRKFKFESDVYAAGFMRDGSRIAIILISDDKQSTYKADKYCSFLVYDKKTVNCIWGMRYKKQIFESSFHYGLCSTDGKEFMAYASGYNEVTFVDFTQEEPKIEVKQLSLSWGRAPIYYLHLGIYSKTLILISGDNRIVLYDTINKQNKSVLSMASEETQLIANNDNLHILVAFEKKLFTQILDFSKESHQHDFFPALLNSLSADAKALQICASHGANFQFGCESAVFYDLENDKYPLYSKCIHQYDLVSPQTYASATAVSSDGLSYAYARGNIITVVNKESGTSYYSFNTPDEIIKAQARVIKEEQGEHVSRLEYTPDGHALLALIGERMTIASRPDGYLFLLDGNTMKPKHHYPMNDHLRNYKFSQIFPNGRYALVLGITAAAIIDLQTGILLGVHESIADIYAMPDGKAYYMNIVDVKSKKPYYLRDYTSKLIPLHTNKPFTSSESGKLAAISHCGRKYAFIEYKDGDKSIIKFSSHSLDLSTRVKEVYWCFDDKHVFIECEKKVILYDVENKTEIQCYYLTYNNDTTYRAYNSYFMRGELHNKATTKVYNNGLLFSDYSKITRLEPSDGYKINEVSVATLACLWNHKTEQYESPTALCPMCGKRFAPKKDVVKAIKDICSQLHPQDSPCLTLPPTAWENPNLLGHECPHCHNKLKFNPFIA